MNLQAAIEAWCRLHCCPLCENNSLTVSYTTDERDLAIAFRIYCKTCDVAVSLDGIPIFQLTGETFVDIKPLLQVWGGMHGFMAQCCKGGKWPERAVDGRIQFHGKGGWAHAPSFDRNG